MGPLTGLCKARGHVGSSAERFPGSANLPECQWLPTYIKTVQPGLKTYGARNWHLLLTGGPLWGPL